MLTGILYRLEPPLAKQLNDLKDDAIKEEIERNAINEQYETKEELYDDIRKMKIEFSSIYEDFYCPLHVIPRYMI